MKDPALQAGLGSDSSEAWGLFFRDPKAMCEEPLRLLRTKDSITPTRQPFGWVIVGTAGGALIAHYCTLYAPIVSTRWLTWHEMEMVRTEATMPLLLTGCVLGALAGRRAEQRLAGRMTLSVAVICVGLLCVVVDEIGRTLLRLFPNE